MQHPEYLYHYTTLDFVPKILEDGFLMLTPSNLVKPKRYWKERREDGNYDIVSDTDDIKPVVWLTQEELGASDDRDKIAIGMAAGGVKAVNKMTAKFVIPWNDKAMSPSIASMIGFTCGAMAKTIEYIGIF